MDRQKLHISSRLLLTIALLLTIGCLVATSGITFARYRAQQKVGLVFQAEKNALICLGVEKEGAFALEQGSWLETVDGTMDLSFAISNGHSAQVFAQVDQLASIRLIATLGAWSAESTGQLVLTVGEQTYIATAARIPESSVLFSEFGDGWIFCFQDENGAECTFPLRGGALDYIAMRLSFSDATQDTNLLQLCVVAANQ